VGVPRSLRTIPGRIDLSKQELAWDGVHVGAIIVPPVIATWTSSGVVEGIVLGLILLNTSIILRWRYESIPRQTLRTIYRLDIARKRAFYLQSAARHTVRTTLGNWELNSGTRKYLLDALGLTKRADTYRTFDKLNYSRADLLAHLGEAWDYIRRTQKYHICFGNVGHTGALLIDDGKRPNIRSSASLYLRRPNAWICLYHEGKTRSFTDFVKDMIDDIETAATQFEPNNFDPDFRVAEPQVKAWLQSQNIGF
jgi:hypothetical protein